jgi:hypothetical protein
MIEYPDDMDDRDEFMVTSSSMISNCCGALPYGEIDEYRCGICSECHEHAEFEKDTEE